MAPLSLGSSGSGEGINWPSIFRSLRKFDPYDFSKDEILDMNLRELQMYIGFTDEEIDLTFDVGSEVQIYRDRLDERDAEMLARLMED